MNNDELYNSLSDRYSTCYYKQDDIPSKDLINTILEESLKFLENLEKLTPLMNI